MTRRELPGWLRASVFAGVLLAVTWLMMWIAAPAR